MTDTWLNSLNVNPIPALLAWDDAALVYFVRRDLLQESVAPVETLWETKAATRLTKAQQPDGSWRYHGKSYDAQSGANYNLIETYRNLRLLVETYGLNRQHPALQKAAEYVFSCQTSAGDVRGIIGNQYMPYYHGAILELLLKAGYADDPRVEKGLAWLLSVRQDDGGWLVPAQTVAFKQKTSEFWLSAPLPPDRSRPHAHLATGMALRAFAAHPDYRQRPEVIAAAQALKSRFFQADKYNDRKAPSYWLSSSSPFGGPTCSRPSIPCPGWDLSGKMRTSPKGWTSSSPTNRPMACGKPAMGRERALKKIVIGWGWLFAVC